MDSKNKKSWGDQLHEAGYRLTGPRELVFTILSNTTEHLSAEEIYIRALKTNSSIGLTTIYRSLDLLHTIGMLQKFDFGDGKARYELINNPRKKEHHHHLICIQCKKIVDYTDFLAEELELMKKTEQELSKRHRFNISHHTVDFYGTCKACESKK